MKHCEFGDKNPNNQKEKGKFVRSIPSPVLGTHTLTDASECTGIRIHTGIQRSCLSEVVLAAICDLHNGLSACAWST